jgi:hypothetical protein
MTEEAPKKMPPYKPRYQNFRGKHFKPYVTAIGQLVLAWNDMHQSFGYLFCSITGDDPHDNIIRAWDSIGQDRSARGMLKAVVNGERDEELHGEFPRLREEVLWLLGQANALEDSRNDAIHTPMSDFRDPPRVVPMWAFGHPRALKLANKPDLLSDLLWIRDTALALRDYAGELDHAITSFRAKWPKRPSLPNRGQKKLARGQRRQPLPK